MSVRLTITLACKKGSCFDVMTLDGHVILRNLEEGNRRSIGKPNEVVAGVLADPALIDAVVSGLYSDDSELRACTI